jgi:hypothetical protein
MGGRLGPDYAFGANMLAVSCALLFDIELQRGCARRSRGQLLNKTRPVVLATEKWHEHSDVDRDCRLRSFFGVNGVALAYRLLWRRSPALFWLASALIGVVICYLVGTGAHTAWR